MRRGIVKYKENGEFKFLQQDSANPRQSIPIPPTSINDLEDKTQDFFCDSDFGSVYFRPGGNGQGSTANRLQTKDMPLGAGVASIEDGTMGAWGYIIKLRIADAGGASKPGSLEGFANFIFIITTEDRFVQPDIRYI